MRKRVEHCHPCFIRGILTPAILCMREPAYQEIVPYGYCEACYIKRCEMQIAQLHRILDTVQQINRIEQTLVNAGVGTLQIRQMMNAAARS